MAAAHLPMTRLGAVSAGTSRGELWGLSAVPTGIVTISAIPVGAATTRWCMAAASYQGQKHIGNPFGTFVGGTATAATVNLSVSATSDDIVAFGFGFSANASLTVNNGTTRASATASTVGRLVIGDITGATAISVSASASTGTPVWGMMAVPVVASATTATTTLAFDNAASTATTGLSDSKILLLTATTGACLLVFLNVHSGNGTVSAVEANGTPLTFLGRSNYRNAASAVAEVWGLTSPASGVLSISAILQNGTTQWGMAAATYVGHRTTAGGPFGGVVTGSGSNTAQVSLVVSTTAGNMVVIGWPNENNTQAKDTFGFNERVDNNDYPPQVIADIVANTASVTAVGIIAGRTTTNWGAFGINLIQSGAAAFVSANAAFTDPADTFTATGYVIVSARLSATDAQDVFSSSADTIIRATIAGTDPADTFSSAVKVRITSRLSATEAFADTFSSSVTTRITARLSATEAFSDTFSSSANVRATANLIATDPADTFSSSAQVRVTAFLSATDAADLFSASAYLVNSANIYATIAATDTPDTFSSSAQLRITANLLATDQPDTFLALCNNVSPSVEAVVVAQDMGAGGGGYERASEEYWVARAAYLRSLIPDLEEPDLIDPPPHSVEVPNVVPSAYNPAMWVVYQNERRRIVKTLPRLSDMRELYEQGARLRRINARLLEQARQANIHAREQRRIFRAAAIRQARRKVILLASLEVARLARTLNYLYLK